MGELVFVGLGLHDENDISLRGMKEIETADSVFLELYTNLMPNLSIERLKLKIPTKRFDLVVRSDLEEESGNRILAAAVKGKTVFLIPGDPFIATTHVDLRIRAKESGITTRVVHGASIVSAAAGLSGLQNYKFGRSVTIPFADDEVSQTPYNVIAGNLELGLHTFCFLDIRVEQGRCMAIDEALSTLLNIERDKKEHVISADTLVVGIARAGSTEPVVKAGTIREVLDYNFGGPPHTLIVPGSLHFMEARALIELADAPEGIKERVK